MLRNRVIKNILFILLLLAGVLILIITYKIDRLEKDLEDLRVSDFHIKLHQPRVSLVNGTLHSDSLYIEGELDKDSVFISGGTLKLSGFDLLPLLTDKKLYIDEIRTEEPQVILTPFTNERSKRKKTKKRSIKQAKIKSIIISKGSIRKTSNSRDTLLKAEYDIALENTSYHPDKAKYPTVKNYDICINHFKLAVDPLNNLHIKSIVLDSSKWTFQSIALSPLFDKKRYSEHLSRQKDRIALEIDSMVIHNPIYNQNQNEIWRADFLEINTLETDIYRDKLLPPLSKYRPMLSKMIRDIPLKFSLEGLKINNGTLIYGELVNTKQPPGEITINDIALNAGPVSNVKKDTLSIDLNGRFMGQGKLEIHCEIPVTDTSERFKAQILLSDLDTKRLDAFTSPNLNVKNTGFIENSLFEITGNENKAQGSVVMHYKDLEVRVMNKSGTKENKFISSIANFFIKKENKNLKPKQFEVKRNKSKSFYNYLWLCIQKGLITSMI